MPAPCLFCENSSGNREHLWPRWIHQRHTFGPLEIGPPDQPRQIVPNPEITIKTVCSRCNNGWMSALESVNVPIIGSMSHDLSIPLDQEAQRKVAGWVVKTAMVLDSTPRKQASARFYRKSDCAAMRESLTIPQDTRAWIGRSDEKHLRAHGTYAQALNETTGSVIAQSTIVTLMVGHFIAQVITQRKPEPASSLSMPVSQPRFADWEAYLLPIWPMERILIWPPKRSFTNGGPEGIAYLMDRWRTGKRADKIVFGEDCRSQQ